jgi:hypothetical protein
MEEDVTRMAEMRNVYEVLFGNSESRIPLRRCRRRWNVNIKIYHKETGVK